MAKKPETVFKERILPKLRDLPNSWWFVTQMIALLGIPDVVGVVNGRFVALELKKSEREARKKREGHALQNYVLGLIRKAGGIGEKVYPENFELIYSELLEISETGFEDHHNLL